MAKLLTIYTYGTQRAPRPPQEPLVRIDCRSLANPLGRVDTPEQCSAFVQASPGFPTLIGHALSKVLQELQHHDAVDCGIYCLYGRHRSPAMAQVLASVLQPLGITSTIVAL